MRGCDHVCTYCIVPVHARPRDRPARSPTCSTRSRRLADDGVREVTFLGQNINTYGKDRAARAACCALLERAAEVRGIDRLRFLTSNPFDMTEDMMRRFGAVPKVMPWLHIPAQSGSDAVLARMKRTYTVGAVPRGRRLGAAPRARRRDHRATSSWASPARPTRTSRRRAALVEEIGFVQAYVFKYSVRPNTLAARRMADDVPEDVKKARNLALLDAQDASRVAANRALVGTRERCSSTGRARPTRRGSPAARPATGSST